MKTIYLVRHAKSSWKSAAATDFDRPLNKRGEEDVLRIGQKLQALNWIPEKIIASPAIRAKQSCKTLCENIHFPVENIEWNTDIYSAYMVTLLHLLAALDEKTKSVMLVGHNPAMEDLLIHLCGYAAVNSIKQKDDKIFTTGNVAKLTTEVAWKNLLMGEAQLETLLRPKEI